MPGTRILRLVIAPPPPDETDAYLQLLSTALTNAGLAPTNDPRLLARAAGKGPSCDIIHLHWLEYIAPSDPTPLVGTIKTARRALRLVRALRRLKRQGAVVVWTIHNLAPHEPIRPHLEWAMARAVMRTTDLAIVHSHHARRLAAERLGEPAKLRVVPHGNYVGVYPSESSSGVAQRTELGIDQGVFVYLAFGQVRRYKRLPHLLRAFSAIQDPNVALLVSGEPKDDDLADELRRLAASDRRIYLDLRRIPTDQVAALHYCGDAAVFAYEDMFSSGAALLALSHELPIIAPADSTGTEIALAEAVTPIGPEGLTAAMNAARTGDQTKRRSAAIASAARYPWSEVASATLQAYETARCSATRTGQTDDQR